MKFSIFAFCQNLLIVGISDFIVETFLADDNFDCFL